MLVGIVAGLAATVAVAVGEWPFHSGHPLPWPLRAVLIASVVIALAYPCVHAARWMRSRSLGTSRPPFAAGLVILWAAATTMALIVPMLAFLVAANAWSHTLVDARSVHLTVQAYVKRTGVVPAEYGEITAFMRAAAARGERLEDFYRPEIPPTRGEPIRYARRDPARWQVQVDGRNACGRPITYLAGSDDPSPTACGIANMFAWFYRRVVTGAP